MRLSNGAWGLGLVTLLALPAAAQESGNDGGVAPGARVRFTVVDLQSPEDWAARRMTLKGTVLSAQADSLVIRYGGASQLTVRRGAIADLAVSRGTEPGWRARPGRTALQAAITAAGGFILARSMQTRRSATGVERRSSLVPLMAGSFVLQSALTAKVAFGRTERWEPVLP